MLALGIDASTSHVGLAVVRGRPEGRAELLCLASVRGDGVEGVRTQVSGVLAVVGGWYADLGLEGARVRIERAPRTARGDVQHGKQAALGWALGYVAGVIEARLECSAMRLQPAELVEVRDWRASMLALSTAWGRPAIPPSRGAARPAERIEQIARIVRAASVEVTFGCGHTQQVERRLLLGVRSCAQCGDSKPVDMGEAWKELACALVAHHFPEQYGPFVALARKRSRKDKPDHKLEGVSDGCEAVWIAASAFAETTTDRR